MRPHPCRRLAAALSLVALLFACESPRPPVSCAFTPAQTIAVGETVVLEMCFYDPDDDVLSFEAFSTDQGVVTAAAAGSRLTLVGVAKGRAEVVITAADPDGLTSTQRVQVTVPNRPPLPVDSIPAREIMAGGADTLDLAPFFSDPDDDPLTYLAAVSDSVVAGATVAGRMLALAALAKGEAEVTVTATDDEGLFATQRLLVTVPNRAPVVTDTFPPLTLFTREADTLRVGEAFRDPDGDPLAYHAEAPDSTVAALDLVPADGLLIVTATSQGETVVTVTATDDEGLAASQSFSVTVPNRSPEAADAIPDRTLTQARDRTARPGPALHRSRSGHPGLRGRVDRRSCGDGRGCGRHAPRAGGRGGPRGPHGDRHRSRRPVRPPELHGRGPQPGPVRRRLDPRPRRSCATRPAPWTWAVTSATRTATRSRTRRPPPTRAPCRPRCPATASPCPRQARARPRSPWSPPIPTAPPPSRPSRSRCPTGRLRQQTPCPLSQCATARR